MNNQGKSSKWQKIITKKEGQKQCNKRKKKKATILWSILYSKCYLLFIYIPYSPKCVRWRMPLSKGAHQNHWSKVIQSIPSYCLYPPQPPRPANPVHKNVAVYPRQLSWNLLWGVLAYPITKYHYLSVWTQPGDRQHDNSNFWNYMNYHQHVYDINITKREPCCTITTKFE